MELDVVHQGRAEDVLETLDPNSVDLVLTSPPFWGLRDYTHPEVKAKEVKRWANGRAYRKKLPEIGLEPHPLDYCETIGDIMRLVHPVLKPTGSLYLDLGDKYFEGQGALKRSSNRYSHAVMPKRHGMTPLERDALVQQKQQLLLLPHRTAIVLQEWGWILRNAIVWYKGTAAGWASRRRTPCYQMVFHFVKNERAYYFDEKEARRIDNGQDVIPTGFAKFKEGKAAMPAALADALIWTTSKPGQVVLDPFAGQYGTTVVSAKRLGRQYIGIELNPAFWKKCKAQLARTPTGNGDALPQDTINALRIER